MKYMSTLITFMFIGLMFGCTKVTLTVSKASVTSGETAQATATVTVRGTPVTNTTVNFTSSNPPAGTLNPPAPITGGSGVATSTFTGGPVLVNTPVNIEAKASGKTNTKTITVKPPVMFDDFGNGIGTFVPPNPDITVAPSVIKDDTCEYTYTYSVKAGNGKEFDKMIIIFTVPVSSVTNSPSGSTITSQLGGRAWTVVLNTKSSAETLVASCSDCAPGPSADWTIREFPFSSPPSAADLSSLVTVGPKAC